MPRVEMCPDQNHLILQFRVCSRNLGDNVVDLLVISKDVLDLQRHLNRLTLCQHTHHTPMILNRKHNLGQWLRIAYLILHPTRTRDIEGTASRNNSHDILLTKHIRDRLLQLTCGLPIGTSPTPWCSRTRIERQLFQLLFRITASQRLKRHLISLLNRH